MYPGNPPGPVARGTGPGAPVGVTGTGDPPVPAPPLTGRGGLVGTVGRGPLPVHFGSTGASLGNGGDSPGLSHRGRSSSSADRMISADLSVPMPSSITDIGTPYVP